MAELQLIFHEEGRIYNGTSKLKMLGKTGATKYVGRCLHDMAALEKDSFDEIGFGNALHQEQQLELAEYRRIGLEIRQWRSQNSGALGDFMPVLDSLPAEAFLFLSGSSGKGKSQQAFGLPADRPVIYLPLFASERPQPIYSCFGPLIELVRACLKRDLTRFRELSGTPDGTVNDADLAVPTRLKVKRYFGLKKDKHSSYIAGLLQFLCARATSDAASIILDEDEKVCIEPIIPDNAAFTQSTHIVFVDEIVLNDPQHRLLRNLLRLWGFKLIVASTNATMANFVLNDSDSRTISGKPSKSIVKPVWCHLYIDFPPIMNSLLDTFERELVAMMAKFTFAQAEATSLLRLRGLLLYCAQNSRPFFTVLLTTAMNELTDDDFSSNDPPQVFVKVLLSLNSLVFQAKLGLNLRMNRLKERRDAVLFGQFCQLLHLTYQSEQISMLRLPSASATAMVSNTADVLPMINRHFANFDGVSENVYSDHTEDLKVKRGQNYVEWRPAAKFPRLDEEPLLYLMTCIVPERRFRTVPYESQPDECLSLVDTYCHTMRACKTNLMAHPFAKGNDGKALETIAFGAAVLATMPKKDLNGVRVPDFLHGLAAELSYNFKKPHKLGWDNSQFDLTLLTNWLIPHFAPNCSDGSDSWISAFASVGRFAKLVASANAQMVDIYSALHDLYIECKCLSSNLSLEVFLGVLTRACLKNRCRLFILLTTMRNATKYAGVSLFQDLEEMEFDCAVSPADRPVVDVIGGDGLLKHGTVHLKAAPEAHPAKKRKTAHTPTPLAELRHAEFVKRLQDSGFAFAWLKCVENTVTLTPLFQDICTTLDGAHMKLFVLVALDDLVASRRLERSEHVE